MLGVGGRAGKKYIVPIVLLALVTYVAAIHQTGICVGHETGSFVRHENSCGRYFMCAFGNPHPFVCPGHTVWSSLISSCVNVWDPANDCPNSGFNDPAAAAVTQPTCDEGFTGTYAHPSECQLYYDCSVVYDVIPPFFEQYMVECPYPELYSTDTHQCEPFSLVNCGDRIEPEYACDYRASRCGGPNCRPCDAAFSDCRGMMDGFHGHTGKPDSPAYVECQSGRQMAEYACPATRKGVARVWVENSVSCVRIDRIPDNSGIQAPDCSMFVNGFYNIPGANSCVRYMQCTDLKFAGFRVCSNDQQFDPVRMRCRNPDNICVHGNGCGNRAC